MTPSESEIAVERNGLRKGHLLPSTQRAIPARPAPPVRNRRRTDPPSDALRIGVVGLGYWGPNLVRALAEMSSVHVAYLCDLDPERVDRFARRYPASHATVRYDDLIADPDLDAVVLATPVASHYELAARALNAGKHVLVEKPLAASSLDAAELIDLAGRNGLTLMCGQTFLHSPPVHRVKRMLDAGELGELYFITSSRVNLGLHQRDVSVIWDLGPHDFSILMYWLGEMPEAVVATGRASIVKDIPDVVFMSLHFPSGIVANVELSWLAPSKLRRTAVVGSKKMVVYEDGAAEPVRVFDHGVVYKDPETFGEYHLSYRTGDITSPTLATTEPIAVELEAFVRDIRGADTGSEYLELARQVVVVAEAAERSFNQGGVRTIVEPARRASG